jgi:beta-glucuronidase
MKHLYFLLLLVAPLFLKGQQLEPLITNVDARTAIDLNGEWHYIIDRYNTGIFNFHMKVLENGYFKDAEAQTPQDLVEYNFTTSPSMQIPGDWNTAVPELYYYEGAVWFQKRFKYQPDTLSKDLFLWLGGANYETRVWVNGSLAGSHEGGFTPFNFNVNKLLKSGTNSIVIRVENERKEDRIPTINTDWWNYGGLTRDIKLLELNKTHAINYKIQLKKDVPDVIAGWVQLNQAGKATIDIPELELHETITSDAAGFANFEWKAKPQPWSPTNPKLYATSIEVSGHTIHDTIGFRTVATAGHEILLNGQPIRLRGICIHEESMRENGRANGRKDALELLTMAKEMNCNYVRLAHYPHNRAMTKMADQLGLMVWSEIPVYWTVQFDQDAVYRNAKQQLTEMINRDHNRASIVIWSMANETPLGDDRNRFLGALADESRSIDPTRLVSAALLTHGDPSTPNSIVIDDPLGEHLDVVAINEYIGWYWATAEKCDEVNFSLAYDKPLIISEFGGGAKAGLHGAKDERWTEEYQEAIYKHNVALFERTPEIAGISPWILVDFRSPRRMLPVIQNGWNRKGLVAPDGTKKKAFYLMQEFYKSW